MAGLIKSNVQLGDSATATQNFTLSVPATPDGTVKLARGNAGATTQDILTVDASGNVNAPIGIQKAGSVLQALSDFTGSNVSLAANGYQKLPSGLIIQWGTATVTGGTALTVTLPIAFPTVNRAAVVTWASGAFNGGSSLKGSFAVGSTLSAITISPTDTTGSYGVNWLAIGY